MFMIRNCHIVRLLVVMPEFAVLLQTTRSLMSPFFTLIVALYTAFYFYAIWGMIWFGGLVKVGGPQAEDSGIPPLYYLINFNDFGMSMVTLFHMMIINNWVITC